MNSYSQPQAHSQVHLPKSFRAVRAFPDVSRDRTPSLRIDVWSDVTCPYSWISEIHLYQAIRKLNLETRVDVRIHAWRLGTLTDTSSPNEHVATAFSIVRRRLAALADEARQLGIRFDATQVVPASTFDAHRLIRFGAARKLDGALLARLHRAYFLEGADVSHHPTLRRLAVETGLRASDVDRVLGSEAHVDDVLADESWVRRCGATGAPFVIVDGHCFLRGLQSKLRCVTALACAISAEDEHRAADARRRDARADARRF